jgi:Zn-dependent M28 family amino/carboxypeptidase
MLHCGDAMDLVKTGATQVSITIRQREYDGESHNVVAELPGRREEYITLSAHYDTTSLSHGAYDNMTGCVGLLGVMEALKDKKLNYGLRFVFCGSEERGLLGSKAYVKDHESEMEKTALNINLDMIGSIMGRFIACVTAEDKLAGYIGYMGAELGFPIAAWAGVYSSDSTSFADKGVPALSFARLAPRSQATIHNRYDTKEILSPDQIMEDIGFMAEFTLNMASAVNCPVSREIPDSVKTKLDEYLLRKRRKDN